MATLVISTKPLPLYFGPTRRRAAFVAETSSRSEISLERRLSQPSKEGRHSKLLLLHYATIRHNHVHSTSTTPPVNQATHKQYLNYLLVMTYTRTYTGRRKPYLCYFPILYTYLPSPNLT